MGGGISGRIMEAHGSLGSVGQYRRRDGANNPPAYWVVGFSRAMFFERWKRIGAWEGLRRERWEGSVG
jgi:hypothetical protein